MKFSTRFGINAAQCELDFVDVDLDTDTPLFVDPYAIATRSDTWSSGCAVSVNSFFQTTVDTIRADNRRAAIALLGELHEPNETRLGLSTGRPSGRGVGGLQAQHLHEALRRSTAVQTGFVEDLADCELLVEGIGPDKISDITTNLIRGQLVAYTQEQCANFGIELRGEVATGPIWLPDDRRWESRFAQLPVVEGRSILLVPKFAVRWNVLLNHAEYYRHFVLNYLQQLHSHDGGLAHLARRRGIITKTALEREFPCSKAFLLEFSTQHRDVFDDYKRTKAGVQPIRDEELDERFERFEMTDYFIRQLGQVPAGRPGETRYHRLIAGLLSFLFYPNLITPRIEETINDGRKRIDITYVNGARSGLFERFTRTTGRPSNKIIVECKNYSNDPGNEEVDQLHGRFADHRGWLGFLLCRTVNDRARLIARCRDIARDHRAYIVPLEDRDVVAMLESSQRGGENAVNSYLSDRYAELTR